MAIIKPAFMKTLPAKLPSSDNSALQQCKQPRAIQHKSSHESLTSRILSAPLTVISAIRDRRWHEKHSPRQSRSHETETAMWKKNHGFDQWNGFRWAEERDENSGLRVKRRWDGLKKRWVVIPNGGSERSVSPRGMRGRAEEGLEEGNLTIASFHPMGVQIGEMIEGEMENAVSDDSLYAAPTRVGSSEDVHHRGSYVVGDDPSREEAAPQSEATVKVHSSKRFTLGVISSFYAATKQKIEGREIPERGPTHPETATKKSTGERPSLWKRLRTWSDESAKTKEGDLQGLAGLLDSVDYDKVDRVRHVWDQETHQWTHLHAKPTSVASLPLLAVKKRRTMELGTAGIGKRAGC